jgi:hypothetical protein
MPRSTTVLTARISHDLGVRVRQAAAAAGHTTNRFLTDLIAAALVDGGDRA